MAEDAMWEAVIRCDEGFDGKFLYAVKTVGVYCHPSCKSKAPLRKNVLYFKTGLEAQAMGYRPCKCCRPDLSAYAPALEVARRAKELMDDHYGNRERLAVEMQLLGVSASHLSALFRREYGLTPTQYLNRTRTEQAKRRLTETDEAIVDIAYDTSFDSLSAFYAFFKNQTGATPRKYRMAEKRS